MITKVNIAVAMRTQKGLDDPANHDDVILGGWNPFDQTFIYHYGKYRLWYKPFDLQWVVWKNEKFCFSFEREIPITDMIERINNYDIQASNN